MAEQATASEQENKYTTPKHGELCWAELASTDLEAATKFYGELLGWTINKSNTAGMDYREFHVGGKPIGGMFQMTKEFGEMPTHWTNYVAVDDVDAAAKRVEELGGKVCVPPTDIPNTGRFCVINDPTGGTISLITLSDIKQIGETVAVIAAITIDGVTREGIGTGHADSETGIKKAEHDALKRAAIKFGIARELYQRESEVIESDGAASSSSGSRDFPKDPIAKSLADLVTPKQLGMIRALGREAGVDVEEACQALLDCRTDELSKRAASNFIEHLQEMSREAASVNVRRAS